MSFGEDKTLDMQSQLCSHTAPCSSCGEQVCEHCCSSDGGVVLCDECRDAEPDKSYEEILEEWKSCDKCTLCNSRTQVVLGSGNTVDPKIFIIGQGPGETEDQEGRPFVGKVSWHLNKVLEAVGIDREKDCYLTNTVVCRPWIPHVKQNRPPTIQEILTCRPRLNLEYHRVKDTVKVIVLVGKEAYMTYMLNEVMQKPGFNPAAVKVGKNLGWHESESVPVYSVYHPSYIARQGPQGLDKSMQMFSHQAWLEDWKRIANYVNTGTIDHFRK